jgi:hypothetical protein
MPKFNDIKQQIEGKHKNNIHKEEKEEPILGLDPSNKDN